MKVIEIVASFLFIVALTLQGVHAFYANTLSTESVEAARFKTKIASLHQMNLDLRSEMLSYTSLEYISSRAAQLGFEQPKSYISVEFSKKVAIVR